jgi:hypothetical protein
LVNLRALGYTSTSLGKTYFQDILANMNNRRYSTNQIQPKLPNLNKIQDFMNNTPPIFDLNSGLIYKQLAMTEGLKEYMAKKRIGVNVYDDGKLVDGSPFPSLSDAALALFGSKVRWSVISRYMDTNKLYKKRFKFESVN